MLIRKKEKTVEILEGQNSSLEEKKTRKYLGWNRGRSRKREQRALKLGRHLLHRDAEKSETMVALCRKVECKG